MKNKIYYLSVIFLLAFVSNQFSQHNTKPKLVVGIVVDQMRFDYLYRFENYFGPGGFGRLLNEGSNFTFAHYNYVPTSTALGHSTIYTGTTPYYHGIIGNNYYDRSTRRGIYCLDDSTENSVGSNDSEGQKSPRKLLATTITDQFKIAFGSKSKVISVSLKDRGAILPGGHMADAAYWYNDKTGGFITSTYYMDSLPTWVQEFNGRKLPDSYLAKGWSLINPVEDYANCESDDSPYEEDLFNEGKTSFPHRFDKVKENKKYGAIESTPYGNELVMELAKAALVNENLGRNSVPDFLAVSFSATDHLGHDYGIFSYELMDTYIRLDKQIAELLSALDKAVGKGNYTLFLTADHAGMETPGYLREKRLPTGVLNGKESFELLKKYLSDTYGTDSLIENSSNKQLYLDRGVIKRNNLNIHEVETRIKDFLKDNFEQISAIYTRDELDDQTAFRESKNPVLNGFNSARSGDVFFRLQPGFLSGLMEKGTTHGSGYSYDTHVPLLFYGWGIPAQTINDPVYVIDIAPTISDLLKITEPSACLGIPLIK